MLRSLAISSALLSLAACGSGAISANEQLFVEAAAPSCGPADSDTNGRTCLAFIVYPDARPILMLTGFDTFDNTVTAHITWRDQLNGRVRSIDSMSEASYFGSNGGRVVGPTDHDWPIIQAKYLGLEGRPG